MKKVSAIPKGVRQKSNYLLFSLRQRPTFLPKANPLLFSLRQRQKAACLFAFGVMKKVAQREREGSKPFPLSAF
jgi:hypothetical protein